MSLIITGASDDLIELAGDIHEEFYAREEGNLLALSNGAVLRIHYSDSGVWRINPVVGADDVSIRQAPEDDEENYSDVAQVNDTITYVVLGSELRRKDGTR